MIFLLEKFTNYIRKMDWNKYTCDNAPETNSVGKCLRICEVILEDGSSCYAYFSSVAGWFTSPCFYFEDQIKSPVKYWRYS